ncbi:hypothetical protein MC885_004843 [Smutsia gigantea]|nr:hypothetical protein MC885_004843 [Smutsia gigantea]
MSLPKGQDHWSKEDIVKLLEHMENNLPSKDSHTFKTTQSQMDWEKVAFKDFSGEMCKLKWLEVSNNLRKFRTLTELVLEAKKHVKNPYKSKKCKKHPDLPKKPLTAYLRFFKEKRPQYSHMYPELSSRDLTTLLSETYKELPEQMKRKYTQDFQKEKREFEEKLAHFSEDHPDLVQNSKESGVPKKRQTTARKKVQRNEQAAKSLPENDFSKNMKFHGEPPKPPMNGYHKFYQDLWASRELQDVPLRERMVAISRRWQRVPQRQKELYKEQAEELQRQYRADLHHWLQSLSPEQYATYREGTCAKPKNMSTWGGPDPKITQIDPRSPPARSLQEGLGRGQGMQASEKESSETIASWGSGENREEEEEEEGSNSSDSSSGDEDKIGV